MSDEVRLRYSFVLTRTEGRVQGADYVQTALEESLDGIAEVYVEDDDGHESMYDVEYLLDSAGPPT